MAFVQNNIVLVMIVVVSGSFLLWELLSRGSGKEVGTLIAVQLINYKNALVLDVREESEYDAGHIANSKHIPADKIKDRMQELEKFKDKPIVVIYKSGVRSGAASSILHAHGFPHVHNLAGGIDTWTQANLPIVKK
ncbi:MAG: rhodanese-like domain-containing protein [Betaproteobacteria bacterium]|nr:rhodanese-like domain-containing protein [Betaproteobacteria bacterium]